MADTQRMSGRTSAFAYAKQAVQGTYLAPTDRMDTTTFNITYNPNVEVYQSLTGVLDAEAEALPGYPEITATASSWLRGTQGIALLKASIGFDTLSGASAVALATVGPAGSTAGTQTIPLTAAPASPPSGVNDWVGAWVIIGTGGTQETAPILGLTSTNLYTWPTQFNHASTETLSIPKQHCFQPNTGTSRASLDYISFVAQFGAMTERQILDAQIFASHIKADTKGLTLDCTVPVNAAFNYEGALTTTIPTAAGEGTDSPFRMNHGSKNGGGILFTYGAAADTFPKPHKRLTGFDWQLNMADQRAVEAGTSVVQHVPGARTYTLTWTENEGDGNFATYNNDFVVSGTTTPAIIAARNPVTASAISVYHPKCVAERWDFAGPSDAIVSRSGSLRPLFDRGVSNIAVRVWALNSVTALY